MANITYIDKEGYEYEAKDNGIWTTRVLNTKRKIQLDEQKIE